MLGLKLFNIFINDLIYFSNIRTCAVSRTIKLLLLAKTLLKEWLLTLKNMSIAISWFRTNQMVANPSKFQVMLLGWRGNDNIVLDIGNVSIGVVNSVVKLLEITKDSKSNLTNMLQNYVKKQTIRLVPTPEYQTISMKNITFTVQLFYNVSV